jgi:hypothetical protein
VFSCWFLCAGLEINPLRETTTSFLAAAFVGLAGVAALLVLLNVATNNQELPCRKSKKREYERGDFSENDFGTTSQ